MSSEQERKHFPAKGGTYVDDGETFSLVPDAEETPAAEEPAADLVAEPEPEETE